MSEEKSPTARFVERVTELLDDTARESAAARRRVARQRPDGGIETEMPDLSGMTLREVERSNDPLIREAAARLIEEIRNGAVRPVEVTEWDSSGQCVRDE